MSIVKSVKNPCMNSELYYAMMNFLGFRYDVTRTIRITYSYHGEISAIISLARYACGGIDSLKVSVVKETRNSFIAIDGDDFRMDLSHDTITIHVFNRGDYVGFLDNKLSGDILIEFDEH